MGLGPGGRPNVSAPPSPVGRLRGPAKRDCGFGVGTHRNERPEQADVPGSSSSSVAEDGARGHTEKAAASADGAPSEMTPPSGSSPPRCTPPRRPLEPA